MFDKELIVAGAKSGGGGKGKSGGDDNNTLRSKARARLVEVISEGECGGLVNGAKSIFFEQTPIQNADNSYNFKNVLIQEHKGLQDEGYFTSNPQVETPHTVEVQVKLGTGPVVRTITEANADAIRVIMRLPALASTDSENGGIKHTSVSWAIDVQPSGGAYTQVHLENLVNQKTTSVTQIARRIALPLGGSPWNVRIRRITADSLDPKLQNDTYWESYVTLVEGKFIYPNTAAVALEVNAEDMGQSIPARSYDYRGIKCLVPTNYDPVTRIYTGVWNGTFKRAVTDCPPWIFYDIITNDRYGMGEFVDASKIDKWFLYTIAQYCDQSIPSGYKTQLGVNIMEPRFTFNGTINNRDEAFFVLQQIATTWRGMGYWCLGQVFATADMPADPVKLVSPANVVGHFEYSGTAMKARHSVAVVTWNDPSDFYRPTPEVVINQSMLNKFGWREKTLQLRGCTSRGLAHRYGKWALDVEQNETETVTYTASWDHTDVRPGDIIALSDPMKAAVRGGGRILSAAGTVITLDSGFAATGGQTYSLLITLPSGAIESRAITSFSTTTVANDTVNIASAFSVNPDTAAMFAITGTDLAARNYRVLTVTEDGSSKNLFRITALFHDPLKYARIEQGIIFDPLPYTRPNAAIEPPSALVARETNYIQNGTLRSRINLSWTPNQAYVTRSYEVSMITPNDGFIDLGSTENVSLDISDTEGGNYKFFVKARSFGSVVSAAIELDFVATGAIGIPAGSVSGISLVDRPGQTTFVGKDIRIKWANNFASSDVVGSSQNFLNSGVSPLYRHNIVKVYHNISNTLLRTQIVTENTFNYSFDMNRADTLAASITNPSRAVRFEVSVTDTFNRTSAAVSAVFTNVVPDFIVPNIVVSGSLFTMTWSEPLDADYVGVLIWVQAGTGYDPTLVAPYYDGRSNSITIPTPANTTRYVRIAGYDAFGKTGLNISAEIPVTTVTFGGDTTPPAVPTGLALASSVISNGQSKLIATWAANVEADLAGYDIEIKEATGNFVGFATNTNRYELTVRSGVLYTAHVRARDFSGNPSAFTGNALHTTLSDTTAPATVAGLSATGGISSIWLSWSGVADLDLDFYEVWESSTNSRTSGAVIAKVSGTTLSRGGLATAVARYYWIRAVDLSGNAGAFSSANTAGVSAVTATIDAADITGTINATTIAADHITGQLTNSQIADIAAAKLTGTITAVQIGNDAITSPKIAAGAITAGKIAAGTIVAGDIAAGTITAEQIAAGAITTEELLVTGRGSAINPDPTFQDPSVWPGATIKTISGGSSSPRVLFSTTSTNVYFSNKCPIDPTKNYLFELEARQIGAGNKSFYAGVYFYNSAGAQIPATSAATYGWGLANSGAQKTTLGVSTNIDPQSGSVAFYFPANEVPGIDWTRYTLNFGSNQVCKVPPNAVSASFFLLLNFAGSIFGEQQIDIIRISEMSTGRLIVDGSITANKISANTINASHLVTGSAIITGTAQIADAIISNAKILDLSAAKLVAGTALAGSITVSGTALTAINDNAALGAQDPAGRINLASTQIDPGKILISGATTLANWRQGGDQTKIAGGSISANTIDANKLTIGLRGITFESIEFEHNKPATNQVSWTAGTIKYTGDANALLSANIAAGSATWTAGVLYIYWAKGALLLASSNDTAVAFLSSNVVIATYKGGVDLVTDYGRTIIEGSRIKTGTIQTGQIAANAITADQIAADSISASKLMAGSVTSSKMLIGNYSNLISNAGFETGDFSSWTIYAGSPTIRARLAGDVPMAAPTAHVCKLPAGNGIAVFSHEKPFNLPQDGIKAAGGEIYKVSIDVASSAPLSGGNYLYAFFLHADGTSSSLLIKSFDSQMVGTGWQTLSGELTVPNGVVKFHLYIGRSGFTASDFFFTNLLITRKSDGSLIVDGSITASKISAGSITADKIAAGAITADQINIGYSNNLLINSDLNGGIFGYRVYNATPSDYGAFYIRKDSYAPLAGALELYQLGGLSSSDIYFTDVVSGNPDKYYDATPGQRFEFSAYFYNAGCACTLFLEWRDITNAVVGYSQANYLATNAIAPYFSIGNYTRGHLFGIAPASTVKVRPIFRKQSSNSGWATSYAFVTRFMLAEATAVQSVPSPWSNNGQTMINGSFISTGAITADKINVTALSALAANVGDLTAGVLRSADNKFIIDLNGGSLSIFTHD
ncbi:MAG: phage tail protein [Undibacterium sp.]